MPTIDTITNTTTVVAELYNTIHDQVADVLQNFYSYSGLASGRVVAGNLIQASEWVALKSDIDLCRLHQTGSTITAVLGLGPSVSFVNKLIDGANLSDSQRAACAQYISDSTSTTRTAAITTATMAHTIRYDFASAQVAEYFFNTGGYLDKLSLGYPDGSYTGRDLAYKSLIDKFNDDEEWQEFRYDYAIWSDQQKRQLQSFTKFDYSASTTSSLKISYRRLTDIRFEVDMILSQWTSTTVPPTTCNLDITVGSDYYYSDNSQTGIGGYIPQVSTLGYFGQPEVGSTPLLATLEFTSPTAGIGNSASPLTFDSYEQGATSVTKTVGLQNTGNISLNITSISASNNGSVEPSIGGISLPLALTSGASTTFTLTYSKGSIGSFPNTFTVVHDGLGGLLTGYTVANVIAVPEAPYSVTLRPPFEIKYLTLPQKAYQYFEVLPSNGTRKSLPLVELSDPVNFNYNYQFPQNMDGVTDRIEVSVDSSTLSAGTYTTQVVVTTTSTQNVTVKNTSVWTVVYTPQITKQLGSWLSPLNYTNDRIGFSYDIISNKPYLTVGLITTDIDTGTPIASTNNLRYDADNNFTYGRAVYPIYDPSHIDFLQEYGVWIRPNTGDPQKTWVSSSYEIYVPNDGWHVWHFSADNTGYFTIDGVLCGDLRFTNTGWNQSVMGNIDLKQGYHTLEWFVRGAGTGPTGCAILITGNLRWSTRYASRGAQLPYKYWAEVYRIPLTGQARQYLLPNYLVKDFAIGSDSVNNRPKRYSEYFNESSMLRITDDGLGNLDISFNPKTSSSSNSDLESSLTYLPNLFYYYSNDPARTTNLDPAPVGDGKQTKFFTGFTKTGQVTTKLELINTNLTQEPVTELVIETPSLTKPFGQENPLEFNPGNGTFIFK